MLIGKGERETCLRNGREDMWIGKEGGSKTCIRKGHDKKGGVRQGYGKGD